MYDNTYNPEPSWSESFRRIWPKVDSEEEARRAAGHGVLVYGILAAFAIAMAFSGTADIVFGSIEALFLATVAFGLRKLSRLAAVLGALYFFGTRLFLMASPFSLFVSLISILLMIGVCNGVRGTFGYSRLRQVAPHN